MEFLAIDTESCTGRDDDGSLCSFGYALLKEDFDPIFSEDIIINPLPARFGVGDKSHLRQTGISFAYTISQFRRAPRFDAVYPKIKELISGRLVIGFSMTNDVKYLNDACKKFSLPVIEYEFLDVQYVYKLLFPSETSTGLKTLSEKYGNAYIAHRADEDALASVTLLKNIIKESGLSLGEILNKYGVHYGKNDVGGYFVNYCDALIEKKFDFKYSKKLNLAIYADFLKKLPRGRKKTSVAFSHKTERSEVDYLRTLIELIYEKGMSFTRDADACTLFVGDEEINNKKAKTISLNEFEKLVGFTEPRVYDDRAFLTEYFETKIKK